MSELPAGWTTAPLGAIGSWGSGGTPSRGNSSYFEGHIPWAVIGDLKDGTLTSTQQTISKSGLDNSSAKLVPTDALLVAMYGSIGKLAITGIECATNQAIAFCIPDTETIFLRYLFYSTLQSRNALNELGQGAGQQNISQTILKNFKIPLAPLAEQKRIAQKLDALLAQVDTLKARIDAIPALLKRFRQAVRASALRGELLSREEPDGSSWGSCTLSDLALVETGKTPDRSEAKYWAAGSIPWVTSAATGLSLCKEAKEFVTALAVRECSLKLFSPGTLLLAMYGEGKTRGQVTELKIQAACNQACAAISVNQELALPSFVKLRLEENYEAIRKMAVGGNQPNLNLGKVREIPFLLPSKETQTEIVRRVEQLFAYADQLEAKVAAAQQRIDALTQSLLAKAFRGELVPQDPTDEPASVLLERIRAQRAATPKPKRGRSKA